ncbi:methylenetetrahydrofolate reductase [Lactobacillaceae bacterium Melli_B3]
MHLALRGDRIPGLAPRGVFEHASDLIEYVHNQYPDINIASACYPECHQEATSFLEDIENLKIKINSGSDHLIEFPKFSSIITIFMNSVKSYR